jgi:cell division protein ZapA (FtsZ GTPase activity inhibitor)
MQAMVPINIVIGDRSYRIKIEPSDEETVRKVNAVINNKILEFKSQFAGKDMQDYIAMVLIWYATQQPDYSTKEVLEQDLQQKLDSLEKSIDRVFTPQT